MPLCERKRYAPVIMGHIEIRVQPKAKGNRIEIIQGNKLRILVTARPEGGKANAAVITLLAKRLGVAKSSVRILRGHKARDKLILVEGLETDKVFTRLSTRQ